MLGVLFITFSGFVLVALATGAPPCSFHYPDYKTVDPDKGCKYYYECKDGVLTQESCLPLAKFNPVSAECEYLGVDCKAKPQAIPVPWPQPPCYSGGPDYLTKSPRGCKYYYRCKTGVVSEEQCESFKWFDPKTTQCRIMLSGCDKPSAPIPTPKTTKTTTEIPTTTETSNNTNHVATQPSNSTTHVTTPTNSTTPVTTPTNSTTDVTTQPSNSTSHVTTPTNSTTPVTTPTNSTTDVTTPTNSTTPVTTPTNSTTHVTTQPNSTTPVTTQNTPVTTQNTSATTQSTSSNPTAPGSTTTDPASSMASSKTTGHTKPTPTMTPKNGTTQKSTTPNSASMLSTKTYFMTSITATLIILQNLFTTYDLSFLT